MLPLVLLTALAPRAFTTRAQRAEALRDALQAELHAIAAEHSAMMPLALGLGWASDDAVFGLAAGEVPAAGSALARPATASDTFLFGSGTKPFTATAVLRFVESGAISLADLASTHIDPVLRVANGTSFVGLFGPAAASITVGHLITMQSGVADFDTPGLDASILDDESVSWPPYALLRAAAATAAPVVHFTPVREAPLAHN